MIYDSPAYQLGMATLNGSQEPRQQQQVQELPQGSYFLPYSDLFLGVGEHVPALGQDEDWLGDAGRLKLPSSNMPHIAVVNGQQLQCSTSIMSQELGFYCFWQLLPGVALFGDAAAGIPVKQLQAAVAAAGKYSRLVYGEELIQHLQPKSPQELLNELQHCHLGNVANCVAHLLYLHDANGKPSGVHPLCERWLAARYGKTNKMLLFMENTENTLALQLTTQWWLSAMVFNELHLPEGVPVSKCSYVHNKQWHLWLRRMEAALQHQCDIEGHMAPDHRNLQGRVSVCFPTVNHCLCAGLAILSKT
jgi:hypothetical protein